MISYTPRGRVRAAVCAMLMLCACGDTDLATRTETGRTHGPTDTSVHGDEGVESTPAAPTAMADRVAPPRLQHEAVHTYDAIALWRGARSQCSATQGVWADALATCACPAQQVFAPPWGCTAAHALQPRLPGCDDAYTHSSTRTRCLKELITPGLAMHLNWGGGKRTRQAFVAHAVRDWTRWFGGALALPTVPGTLHLANGRRFNEAITAWLDFDGGDALPLTEPWSPRAALHEGAAVNLGPTCATALQNGGVGADAIAPLCEGITTTQAAVREPRGVHGTELRALVVSTNAQADVGLVQARYAWQRVSSTYRVPWAYNVAVNRHIVADDGFGNRVAAFLSPTGTVHAWAVAQGNGWLMLDDAGKGN